MKKNIYPERESKNLELKSTIPKFSILVKTCIAFANGFGGQIVIGVEDATREIKGIKDRERERLYDEFPNSIYDSVSPVLAPRIWEKAIGDVSVLIIDIPPSPKKPYFLKSEGIPRGVYIRVGSSTRKANEEYVHDLIREGQRITFDEEALRESMQILSKERLHTFYEKRVSEKRLLADKIVTTYPANQERYAPTVGGTLFFCDSPEDYISEAVVLCTQFQGNKGREILRTEELTGPIPQLAEKAFELLVSWLKGGFALKGVYLKRSLPLPIEALREAILNALIHRKYSIPGAVKMALYEHRLEIFSPGCFPGVVDVQQLGDGTTYLRNPVIARLARRAGLVEKLGRGIRLIFDSCRRAGLRKPEYAEGGDFVKITFFFEPQRARNRSEKQDILDFVKVRGEVKIKDLMEFLGVSRNTVTRRLKDLMQDGKLRRIGKGPSVRYVLSRY